MKKIRYDLEIPEEEQTVLMIKDDIENHDNVSFFNYDINKFSYYFCSFETITEQAE